MLKSNFYIKDVIFWDIFCCCNSKIEITVGGLKSCNYSFRAPLQFSQSLSFIKVMYLKRSYFLAEWRSQHKKHNLFEKVEKNQNIKCHFILQRKRVILLSKFCKKFNGLSTGIRVVGFWKFYHFSKHHFPKDSESALKSGKRSILKFTT